ncbi:hypothetical protein SLEP1_g5067 [Rubroshorea leprosula]|uniref:Uncharacterized protein n=1 Tax=Rubroshorea leprosula TaxID=152421 RepID=A0AAV5HZQ5_9ROSI|nr:hypothetical protein SLEP1_g5067 [Rubroshorea leprosula]
MEGKIKEAHQLSVAKRYKDIDQLAKATNLAIQCEKGIPLSYNATQETSMNMILTCQTSNYVNAFITQGSN